MSSEIFFTVKFTLIDFIELIKFVNAETRKECIYGITVSKTCGKGATFTLPTKYRDSTLCKIRGLNTTRNEVWRFQPRHLLLDLAVESIGNNFAV